MCLSPSAPCFAWCVLILTLNTCAILKSQTIDLQPLPLASCRLWYTLTNSSVPAIFSYCNCETVLSITAANVYLTYVENDFGKHKLSYIKHGEPLERLPRGLQMTRVRFQTPTWCITTICKISFRGLDSLLLSSAGTNTLTCKNELHLL